METYNKYIVDAYMSQEMFSKFNKEILSSRAKDALEDRGTWMLMNYWKFETKSSVKVNINQSTCI